MFLTCELHVKTGSHRVESERESDIIIETDRNRYFFRSIPEILYSTIHEGAGYVLPSAGTVLERVPHSRLKGFSGMIPGEAIELPGAVRAAAS